MAADITIPAAEAQTYGETLLRVIVDAEKFGRASVDTTTLRSLRALLQPEPTPAPVVEQSTEPVTPAPEPTLAELATEVAKLEQQKG